MIFQSRTILFIAVSAICLFIVSCNGVRNNNANTGTTNTNTKASPKQPESEAAEVLARLLAAEEKYSADPSEENWKAVAECLDPEFVLYQAASLPFAGEWRGRDGFRAWMRAMADNFTSFKGRDARVITSGDTVIVVLTLVGEARKTGQHIETPLVQVNKVRGGRMLEVRPFYWDTAATSAALGHNPAARKP